MKKKPAIQIIRIHIAAAAAAALVVWVFSAILQGCPIRAALGVPCPTCGMTRSLLALLRLDLRLSFSLHPLTIPFGFALWFAIHRDLFRMSKKAKDAILILSGAAVFAVYLARLFLGDIP